MYHRTQQPRPRRLTWLKVCMRFGRGTEHFGPREGESLDRIQSARQVSETPKLPSTLMVAYLNIYSAWVLGCGLSSEQRGLERRGIQPERRWRSVACLILTIVSISGFRWPPATALTRPSRKPSNRFQGHTSTVNSIAFSRDGRLLLSASRDATVRLWDVKTQRTIRTWDDHAGFEVVAAVFSPTGHLIASAGGGFVRIRRVSSGQTSRVIRHPTVEASCLAFSPDGRFIASAWRSREVWISDVKTGTLFSTLPEGGGTPSASGPPRIRSLAYSHDGRYLATASDAGGTQLWNARRAANLGIWRSGNSEAWGVVFEPSGRFLISIQGNAIQWLKASPWGVRRVVSVERPRGAITCLSMSVDGKLLATASQNVLTIWSASSGRRLADLKLPEDWITAVAFHPNGRSIAAAAGLDINIWRLPQKVHR